MNAHIDRCAYELASVSPDLSQMEEDIQKPVVNSSQATTWVALRSSGITTKIQGVGSLFVKH